jgi:hypothetical protein
MKKTLILLLAVAALSCTSLPAQKRSSGWQFKVEVYSKLRFNLSIESDLTQGVAIHAFTLQILETTGHPLFLLEIGGQHHA